MKRWLGQILNYLGLLVNSANLSFFLRGRKHLVARGCVFFCCEHSKASYICFYFGETEPVHPLRAEDVVKRDPGGLQKERKPKGSRRFPGEPEILLIMKHDLPDLWPFNLSILQIPQRRVKISSPSNYKHNQIFPPQTEWAPATSWRTFLFPASGPRNEPEL